MSKPKSFDPTEIYARRRGEVTAHGENDTVEDSAINVAVERANLVLNSNEALGRTQVAKKILQVPQVTAEGAIDILKIIPRSADDAVLASSINIYKQRQEAAK